MGNRCKFLVIPFKTGTIKASLMRLFIVILALFTISFNNAIYAAGFQQVAVGGTITDLQGAPLIGVTVVVKGSTAGTLSDANGKYSISNVPQNATLIFSFIGMTTQEIQLNGRVLLDVVMAEAAIGLNEVVVIGYGTVKKVNLTGAVSQVNSTVLENRPVTNIGQSLEGTISNLQITQKSFATGEAATFSIRGYASLNGGSPLILVDGVVMDPNLLNPNDIETVSVLKDASSSAVYGARAAYGVILITTKSGSKDQRPTLKVSSSYTITSPINVPETADSKEMMDFINRANINTTGSPYFDQRATDHIMAYYNDPENNLPVYYDPAIDLDGNYKWCGNTNWAKELYKSGLISQTNVSLSGGSEKTSYYFSYGNLSQSGNLNVYDDKYNRQNFNININSEVNNWLTVSSRMKYTYGYIDHPSQNQTGGFQSWDVSPLIPVKLPDGTYAGQALFTNPFSSALYGGYAHTKTNDFVLTGTILIHPIKGLNINADYTFNPYALNKDLYVRSFLENKADGTQVWFTWSSPNGITNSNDYSYYKAINAYADYSLNFSKNSFKLLVGFNQETKTTKSVSAQRQNLIDNNLPAINRAIGAMTISGSESLWAVQGAFFRLNYDYDNKYLLELNGRYDGSSKFPKGDRFALFPSLSAGWVASKEAFWEGLNPYVSYFKIRGSYGSLGNQAVSGDFPYVSSYAITNQLNYLLGGSQPIGILSGSLVSPSFTWEKVNQWNIGADLGFIQNKLTVSLNVYNRYTIGMLTAGQTLPNILGTSVPRENAADLKTYGWELDAAWKGNSGKFSYSINANLSDAQSEITKFSNPTKLLSSYYVGQKIGEIWGYDVAGLFQSNEEIAGWADQSQLYGGTWIPGDVKYVDRNNDGKITRGTNTLDDPGDQHVIGNNTPRYLYGITLNGAWNGFDMSIFIQGVGKRDLWFSGWRASDSFFGTNGYSGWVPYKSSLDYWTEDNTDAFYPNSYLNGWGQGGNGNRQASDRYLQNAAYIRLKQVSIGYTVPENTLNRIKFLSKVRFYANIQNSLTFTKLIDQFDPELTGVGDYPLSLAVNFGIDLTF